MTALLVALGAAVGAPARFVVVQLLRHRLHATPAAGTLTVNVVGSFVLGLAVSAGLSGNALGLVGTGFCGALTTFSTFGLEVWTAAVDGERRHAVANIALSLALGLAAAYLGWVLVD